MITDDVAPLRHDVEPWFMSGFEFRCAWQAMGLDYLPFPLAYRHRGRTYMAEVEADRRAALARMRAGMTPNRMLMLEALRFPAFMMLGFGRIRHGADEELYRLFGVVGRNGYCAAITQDPGDEFLFGEDIQIIGCVNIDFPQVVIEALPDCKPGTKPRKDARLEDETPADFFRESKITVSILLGGSAEFTLDYELRNANYLTFVNVDDDGAYVVNEGTDAFQIIPATVPNLLDVIAKVEQLQLKAAERISATSARDFDGIP
jgi:EspG family